MGEGPEETTIRKQIHQIGLLDRVLMLGYRDDSLSVLRSLDLFVMPSIEGDIIPQVLFEAMAVGLPVIATTTTGSIPDVIHDGITELLVPPRDSLTMGRHIEKLLTDNVLARLLGHKAFQLVMQAYSLEAMLNRLEQVYRNVMAQRR